MGSPWTGRRLPVSANMVASKAKHKKLIAETFEAPRMDFVCQLHHIPFMTRKQPERRNQSAQVTGALATWEDEGGVPQPKSRNDSDRRAALAGEEEHVLRCLGAAVIMQWNDLPTKIQRDPFDHAISMGEPRHTAQLNDRVARFLQRTKDDESGRMRTPFTVRPWPERCAPSTY